MFDCITDYIAVSCDEEIYYYFDEENFNKEISNEES